MSEVIERASAARGNLFCGALLSVIGLLLALGLASPAAAAPIQGADGGDGGDGSVATGRGDGGDGGGNAGSGGVAGSATGLVGTGGTGGGGGRGGGSAGATGGDSEFGLGGLGSSIGKLPPGGGEEAGGGGGQSSNPGAGGGGGGGGQRGLTIITDTAAISAADTVSGGQGGKGGNGSGNSYADGGGGGGGGIGVVYTGTNRLTVDGTIAGGDGGLGGNGDAGFYTSFPNVDPITQMPYTQVIGSFGGSGGSGGTGLRSTGAAATIEVNAAITGGDGGDAGLGSNYPTRARGGPAGAGLIVTGGNTTITVNAAISGGTGGLGSRDGEAPTNYEWPKGPRPSTYGVGGAGIIGADLTVVLGPDGSISGGLSGNATIRANAITFTGGANSFELQADGSTVVGNIVADGTGDVFRLGGANAGRSFDTTLLGTQYTGFESFEKVGTGTWTLTGTPGVTTAWAVTDGTLALPGAMTTDITTSGPGTFALQGGTLDGTLDNGGTTNAHGEITGAITNAATGTFNLDGDLVAGSLISNDGLFTAHGAGSAASFAVTGGSGFTNSGTISLSQAGGMAGDVLDLTGAGAFDAGSGSELALDIDLSGTASIKSDQLLLGVTTGALQVSFNPDPSRYGALTGGVLVLETADGNLQATATGLQDRGLVDYAFEQIGTDWYVTSRLNAAPLGGIVAGMQSVQNLTDASSRPVALNSTGACAAGVYSDVHGGTQGTTATTASDGENVQSDVAVTYGGAQFDLDFGCLDLGQGDATIRLGLVGGFSTGNAQHQQALSGNTSLQSSNDFMTGYAGIYAQLRSGGLIVDGQLGYDRTGFELTADIAGGTGTIIDAQQTDTQRLTATGSIGYAFELDGVTLTPTAGLGASHAQTSAIQLADLGGRLDIADRGAVTAFGGIEMSTTVALADGGGLRYFGSGMLYADFGGAQAFTYSDDINGPIELETTATSGRGTLGAGVSYEGTTDGPGGTSVGLRGDLSYSGGQFGTGLTLQAGVSF